MIKTSWRSLWLTTLVVGATCGLALRATPAAQAAQAAQAASASSLLKPPYAAFEVPRADGSRLQYYVRAPKGPAALAPVVIFEIGSGCNSQFFLRGGKLRGTLYSVLADLAPGCVVAASEKRGVSFGEFTGNGQDAGCTEAYTAHATWEQRVSDAGLLLDTLRRQGYTSPKVLLVGHSEGADVVAGVAGRRPDVTHVAFLAGGGPTQMFDFAMLSRRDGLAKHASAEETEGEVERLQQDYRDILADPLSTKRTYRGHAFLRWSGFLLHPPVEGLLASHAKLFVAHGSADTHVPIESFDALAMELIRAGRTNAAIRRYPGAGHGFERPDDTPQEPALERVFKDVLIWFAAK